MSLFALAATTYHGCNAAITFHESTFQVTLEIYHYINSCKAEYFFYLQEYKTHLRS